MRSVVVGDQGPGDGLAGGAVVPDGCGEGQDALGDAYADAFDGASAVEFQVELAFEGVVDRLDQLSYRLQQRFGWVGPAVAVGRADQRYAVSSQVGVQFGGDVALVTNDDQARPVGE